MEKTNQISNPAAEAVETAEALEAGGKRTLRVSLGELLEFMNQARGNVHADLDVEFRVSGKVSGPVKQQNCGI